MVSDSIPAYLSSGGWTIRENVETRLAAAPAAQKYTADVTAMVARGASLNAAAAALGITWTTARAALACAEAGEPSDPLAPSAGSPRRSAPPYQRIAPQVARRRDDEGQPMDAIAEALGVSAPTAWRAYGWAHRGDIREAAAEGRRVDRGRLPKLGVAKHRQIIELLQANRTPEQVAAEVGCGRSTVYRVRKALAS